MSTSDEKPLTIWFRKAFSKTGFTQVEFAKKLSEELRQPFQNHKVHKMLTGERDLSYNEVIAVAKVSNSSLPNLGGNRTLPVVGAIRAGGKVVLYRHAVDFVPIPPDGETDLIALEVSGNNAVAGIAYDNWVVMFAPTPEMPTSEHKNSAVLAVLNDGTEYVRVLIDGSEPGKWTLRQSMTGEPAIVDADIKHIHRMAWVRPR